MVVVSRKNIPTTRGLRLGLMLHDWRHGRSEKYPHYTGIKTGATEQIDYKSVARKNIPTTRGLRPFIGTPNAVCLTSEKYPHYTGIKTQMCKTVSTELTSEKYPHYTGIKTWYLHGN